LAARLVDVTDSSELASYAQLRDRDLARNDGLFVAEGEVVVRMLASPRQTHFRVRSLLVERRRVEAIRDVLDALSEEVPAYVAPQELMSAVVGFDIHRGILAMGERGSSLDARALLDSGVAGAPGGKPPVAIGLVGLTNHDNVGSVFRNAAAFGACGVLLDNATCDPLYRKSIRVSVGAALVVPFARCASPDALLDTVAAAGWEPLALSARGDETLDAVLRSETDAPGRILMLGTEGHGLPAEILARTRRVRIDMTPTLDSLNVAVASGIALYEAMRPR
jgi:tRNA G18 (ribose-2'-O)-methylase SpoU